MFIDEVEEGAAEDMAIQVRDGAMEEVCAGRHDLAF